MPDRAKPPTPRACAPAFRRRYDELERHRTELLTRLARLDDKARSSPSYKRALTLLNATFRKATLAQRAAILQAATWLIDVVEMWSMMM